MRRLVLIALVLAVASQELRSQTVVVRELTGTPVVVEEAFSDLTQVVELADGRVLVYDAIERRLDVVSFVDGQRQSVTTQGAGPREFRAIVSALRAAGDTLLLWDPPNDRVLALSPSGVAIGTWPSEGRTPRGTRLIRAYPRALDQRGSFYATQQAPTDGDSATLVRVRSSDGRTDTLTRLPSLQLRPERAGPGVIRVRAPGFPSLDAWGVFPDGRVLVVRGTGYLPEIIAADGSVRRGAAIAYVPAPVTAAMRSEQLRTVVREMQRRLLREAGGGRSVTLPRVEPVEPAVWPTHLPAVASATIHIDGKQRAWVHVTDASAAQRYDLLDVDGRRVGSVRLPSGARLVGMGRDAVYVAVEDADGLLQLRRYATPQ
jgi:hypothetical protein